MFYGTAGGDDLQKQYEAAGKGMYTDSTRDMMSFLWGEMAANNALERQEHFYNTYQSPKAQMQQLKEAGLSPSIFFAKGIAGGAGTSGVAGAPRSSANTDAAKLSAILSTAGQAAQVGTQIAQVKAQTENIKADTQLKLTQAGLAELQQEYQHYMNENQNVTNNLLHAYTLTEENNLESAKSFYEIATEAENFSQYMQIIKNAKWDPRTSDDINTEIGNKILRDIYINVKEQNANIAALDKEKTNNELAQSILKTLESDGYAKLSAQEQINALKRNVEASKLDKETNEAWNNLLGKLGDGTKQDVAIVIGLLLKTLIGNTSFNNSTSHSYIQK